MTEKRKDDENNSEDEEEQLAKSTCGKTVTLQMLLDSNILSPGKGNMSIEYMGQKFIGDLLEDGKIKSHETETIFCSPSAWAINCKKIINPEKKSGCGWASVRYNGKKLDIFKAQYHKKIQKKKEEEVNEEENEVKENLPKLFEEIVVPEKQIQKHQLICNRTVLQDINMLVETVPFSSIGRIQPFNVNVSISALLVMDFHCHLTVNEVFGYFGGTWDFNTHNLTISHCFPLLNSKKDRSNSSECEAEIQKMMIQKNIELVGWYHSHHRFPAFPTLKDCDKQLNYQIKLRGNSDLNYTPCIGFIHASYNETENIEDEAKVQPFWVLPPPENRPYELGKPLIVHTNNRDIDQDLNVLNDIKSQLKSCVDYYEGFKLDMIDFKTAKFKSEKPVLEKFKNSIFHKLPSDEVVSAEIWNWILELLKLPKEETVEFPKSFLDRIASLKNEKVEEAETAKAEEMKNSDENAEKTIESVKVPTPSAVLPLPASYKQSLSSNSTSFSSPRDSPASIPSSANSPAKFEVPSRSTPSPAKSESPSLKPRSSPAKIHLASNLKYDDWQNEQKKLHAAMFEFPRNANSNNFILPGEDSRRTPPVSIYPLPSSFGQNSTKKTSTSTSNNTKSNQKANKNANHWLSQIPNMEDFLKQLEKGDLSVLMQSPYNLPAYSQPKDDQKSSSKNYDVKSSSTSMNKKKEKAPIDPYSSLHLDALKGNSEKLLNLMKSPEYTQMLLKSAKMSNFDADTIEKLSAPYSQSLHSSRINHSSSTSSSSRQQTMSDSLPKSSKTAQSNSSPYYPPFDMKYFNEITKQASQPGSKKNFPSNPEDFNALLQMELFSKTMSPSPSYGKSSSSVNQSRAEESRKAAEKSQLADLYGIPASLRNYMYDMPTSKSPQSSSTSKSSSSQHKSQSSTLSKHNQYNQSQSSLQNLKDKSSDSKHSVGYNTADIMKLNSFLGSSKDAAMIHPIYNDYYAQSLSLLNAQSKGSMSGETSSPKNSNKDFASFSQMIPSQLHAMSSLFPGTKPSDLEAILKNSYFSDQMIKAQREMIDACSKATRSSPYKKNDSSRKDPPQPSKNELEISIQKSMENVANSIFKYGDLANFNRSYSATSTDSSRKSLSQSPVDFVAKDRSVPPKKRMEFSSIAELSSSSKKPKYDDDNNSDSYGGGALNLSSK